MKILYVLDSLGTGGAERSTADLWYYLQKKEIEIFIITLGHRKQGIEEEILAAGFNVWFLKSKGIALQCNEIARLIKKIKPDIVHSILFKSNLRVRIARFLTKFIHVESLVNCSYDPVRLNDPRISSPSFYYYKNLDRFTTQLVDHFLAITETVKKHYHAQLQVPLEKIQVLYRGRNKNQFLDQRNELRLKYLRELNLPRETQLVLHVGRQEFQKGHLILLKAIQYIEDKITTPVAYIFLGREGNSSQDIEVFLKENKLKSKFVWLGHRQDVAQWMAAADIFVFPSLYEGLGGVLIEAQAASLPIICSDIPVLNEVVLRNKNALMFEAGNIQELSECLGNLLNHADRRQEMGENSIRNFKKKFLLRYINEASLTFYEQLIG